MEQRTVERFRTRAILIHWLHAASFSILLVTGIIMFFDLTSMSGGQQIRVVHRAAAAFFVIVPVLFSLFDPKDTFSFLKEAFRWDLDNLAWLKASIRFYFGHGVQMPPQGYINGDQKLWQLIVIVTGLVFTFTGIMMWFFKLKIPLGLYHGLSIAHVAAFVIVSLMVIAHFFLTTLHPRFNESLSSMVDGKVSRSYAQARYSKWARGKIGTD